ncbi:HAMP domain-containing sensor histidine kinase [Paenibacillus nasutitermitis]|uniref:Sensor histidine kinase n=1 Tax=Paenibacillus nasutitermitis TaxID=1652958 RepID=A0A916YRP9_9BACL|nr:sensor histidine kinase [Paenibacillus nasutitermitis]GGD58379.1 sensor histidine kinase LiaS [Paenibacillus nasutitermitis]
MNMHRMVSIRWKLTIAGIVIALLLFAGAACAIVFFYKLDFLILWVVQKKNIPLILILSAAAAGVGAVCGWTYGSVLKKRLDRLMETITIFERGNFVHRVVLRKGEEDEIGLMASRLNEMAGHIQRQIAALQKLSTEKAEMGEQLKKSAILEERQRLARELHDAVSQQLFAISMMTSTLTESPDLNAGKARKQITMVDKLAGNAQNEMRALLRQLRPATLEGKSLKEGLQELVEEIADKQSLDIRSEIEPVEGLPKGVEDHLFRITQEGLSNVLRHSQADSLSVKLGFYNKQIHLKITDNGIGFDANAVKSSSFGLKTVQERAHEIGGVATIVSFPGKGTQLEVKVPIIDHGEERRS